MPLLKPATQLGRYTVLGKLATGGMSEIYLAKQSGIAGFSKVVVLKVILPHLADDPSFMQMFLNEAKLAAMLNHPNVVQIFDFGESEGQYYIAMEHIDGQNLRGVYRTLRRQGRRIPRHIALRIIADTCGALQYAHRMTGPTGQPLELIHRDVSLENILVTYSGQVKLVDFGVAKAATLESYTSQGTLKGKYSYMAPELIRGETPDHRIDIFALGVVMYAVLLGRMPFKAKNHAQILDQILREQPPPPREIDPELPEELERVVVRAMHKEREKRYQHAGELHAELEGLLAGNAVMPFHLAQFMDSTFPPGTDDNRATFQQLVGAAHLTPSQPKGPPAQAPRAAPPGERSPVDERSPSSLKQALADADALLGPASDVDNAETRETLAPPVTADPLQLEEEQTQSTPPPPMEQEDAPTRPLAVTERQDAPTRPLGVKHLAPEAAEAPLRPVESFEYLPATMPKPAPPGRRHLALRGALVLLGAAVVALGAVAAWILSGPDKAPADAVVVASRPVADAASAAPAARPDTTPIIPDARSRRRPPTPASAAPDASATPDATEPDLGAAPHASLVPDAGVAAHVDRPPGRPTGGAPGRLTVSAPGPAEAFLDGRPLGALPIESLRVPPGRHRLVVRSKQRGYQLSRWIVVQAGARISVPLSPGKGTLRVLVRPWARVSLDGKPLGITPLSPISLFEGTHTLELENAELKAKKRQRVQIQPGRETVVKIRMDQ